MINKKILMISGIVLLLIGATYAAGIVFFSGDSQGDTDDGLVLDIDLSQDNYVSGTKTFADDSREGNNGVSAYAVAFSTDKYGKSTGAMSFNGVSDYINISHDESLDFVDNYTLSAWVYPNQLSSYEPIFVRGAGSADDFEMYIQSASSLVILHNRDNGASMSYVQDWKNPPANQWTHLVLTYSLGNWTLYHNAIMVNTTSGKNNSLDTDKTWMIGTSQHSVFGASRNFNGSISEVKIWNRALSSAEVQTLYNSSKPKMTASSIESGLVGHWMLDNASYNSATNRVDDITPYSNHGTNSGANFTTDRMGHSNGAMFFDGSNDYINVSNNSELNPQTAMTITFWMKPSQSKVARIINKWCSTGPNADSGQAYAIYQNNNNLCFLVNGKNATDHEICGTKVITDGNWYFVVGTADNNGGANNQKLYVNGVIDNQKTSNNITAYTLVNLQIGGSTNGYPFNGSIADVRVYNRSLSATEISALYNSYNPKAASDSLQKGLVLDMSLTSKYTSGGAAGSEIIDDKTPYSNNGQNYGASVGSNYTNFDGLNDYVYVVDNNLISGRSALTISYWLKRNANTTYSAPILISKGNADTIRIFNNNMMLRNAGNTWYGSGTTVGGTTYLEIGTWYHVAFTFNGTNRMVYTNGVLEGTSSPATSGAVYSSVNNISIGYPDYPPGTDYLNGSVSSLKIYNRALSDSEIKLLYARGRQ